ncbi:hypothetical protein [Marinoscillum sp.]|uniref:hypothetical protein n=1 Tax=Marinoscillum sp. TaxID=2024838 RepID=UPI003BAC830D
MKPTDEELAILKNDRFLRLKNEVSEKIIAYLAEIERALHQEIKLADFQWPEGTFLKAGKISKGEQYRGLPYFILDYPRLFTQKEVFAFRNMLWWGHHYSCTLHLQGPLLKRQKEAIAKNLLSQNDVYFCVNDQPWDYHYESSNYLQIKDLALTDILYQIDINGFIKLSSFIPVDKWDEFYSFTLTSFARFLKCIHTL